MRSTQIVRNVLRQFGVDYAFTNKYKNCRTVKCYRGHFRTRANQENAEICIKASLAAAGIEGASISDQHAFIVRLPLDY